ncbi:hypothetical protein CBL_10714 [Carabus blaptoides fortunei]
MSDEHHNYSTEQTANVALTGVNVPTPMTALGLPTLAYKLKASLDRDRARHFWMLSKKIKLLTTSVHLWLGLLEGPHVYTFTFIRSSLLRFFRPSISGRLDHGEPDREIEEMKQMTLDPQSGVV